MEIRDPQGRPLLEVTVHLTEAEISDLLVAASEIEEGASGHAVLRDEGGNALALYRRSEDPGPLTRQTDWLIGPAILLAVILMAVGAFTVARGLLRLFF
ncbi:MAG: hypothetical protein ACRDJO_07150 [Actinomycetota bacterium]